MSDKGGTHVLANQGGCTVWCDDCGESHNCESWTQKRTQGWMASHGRRCPAGKRRRIRAALSGLRAEDLPMDLIAPVYAYADALTKGKKK